MLYRFAFRTLLLCLLAAGLTAGSVFASPRDCRQALHFDLTEVLDFDDFEHVISEVREAKPVNQAGPVSPFHRFFGIPASQNAVPERNYRKALAQYERAIAETGYSAELEQNYDDRELSIRAGSADSFVKLTITQGRMLARPSWISNLHLTLFDRASGWDRFIVSDRASDEALLSPEESCFVAEKLVFLLDHVPMRDRGRFQKLRTDLTRACVKG